MYLPERQEGSVYLYYSMQAPRERPLGYSTTAPPEANAVAGALAAPIGNPRSELLRLGVGYVVEYAGGRPLRLRPVVR